MAVNINHRQAEEIILEAYRSACTKNDFITDGIREILGSSHKTYKYVLVNGILAKATSENVNPIALQAGAPLAGAFDARSLCHKVLVPFERDFLRNILGGSNEPFLNKPARFTHLDGNNAVRKGKDKKVLLLLINLLSAIETSDAAKQYLACILCFLRNQIEEKRQSFDGVVVYSPTLIEIYEFSLRFVERSLEGETSAIIVGALESLLHESMDGNFSVKTHKINQSGASSKEIGDIDVFDGDSLCYAVEVKDKNFNEYDVEHAFNKVLQNQGKKAAFVYGLQANFDKSATMKKVKEFEEKGLFVVLQDIDSHIKNILFRLPACTKEAFVKYLITTSKNVNCKSETLQWMNHLFLELQWKVDK
jgi:hypothetical protein